MTISKIYSKKAALFICLTLALFHLLWVYHVDPFPEKDSIFPFYFPFLNYLYATTFVGNDYFFLLQNLNSSNYPIGVYTFAFLISSLSLQTIFLEFPYLLTLVMVALVCVIPTFSTHKYKIVFPILLFFNPLSTLCIRSFSPHSFIVFFGLISFLSFRSLIYKVNSSKLILFAASSILAMSIKHLGLLYFIILGISYTIWIIVKRKANFKLIAVYLSSLGFGLLFYPINNSFTYLKNAIAHNDTLNMGTFFFIALGLIFFLVCIFYMTNFNLNKKRVLPKLFSYFLLSTCLTMIICFLVVTPSYSISQICLTIIVISGILIGIFSYFFNLSDLRGFTYIFITIFLIVSSLLYFSHIGKSFYVFLIPLLLTFHQSYCESKSIKLYIMIIIAQIFCSNFFPSLQEINKRYSGIGDLMYTTLFNVSYVNYLAWEPCSIPKIRKEITDIISLYDFPVYKNKLIFINLHQHTQVSLYLPYNLQASHPTFAKLEDSLATTLDTLKAQTIDHPFKAFSKAQESNMFPLIIEAIEPFTQNDTQINDSLVEVLINKEKSLNEFAQVFALEYFKRLQKSNQLKTYYHHFKSPVANPILNVYIKKSVPIKTLDKFVNYDLNELITNYKALPK